jgi:hypothetical protein
MYGNIQNKRRSKMDIAVAAVKIIDNWFILLLDDPVSASAEQG